MKTLLVSLYPYQGQGLDSWQDHGAGVTYTVAKASGYDIDFLDMKSLYNDTELQERLQGYDLIAISLKSSYYAFAMKVVKMAKLQGSKVLIGGYHATAAPNELLENPDIDYIFHGESEITFPEFLKNPDKFPREIFGEKPPNLDAFPFMDRSIFREPLENCLNWWYGGKLKNMTTVASARGCPYKCGFCQPLENDHFGKKLRRRSVNSIIDELKQLKELYNPDCVMFHDSTFLLQPKWLDEFIERYPEIGLPFWASARADGICRHPEYVEKLVKIGWELISVGFESGSQRILDKIKKGTTVEQNLKAARIIKSNGAKIYANYMTALPWETKWDIQATHKMADEINAEMPSWAFFAPYPGCALGEECIERGWSLLNKETYDRCPSGKKVKHVDYDYVGKVRRGLREETYPEFCDIIIPTYNNEDYTISCLESINKHTKPGSYRVIWVDNGSKNSNLIDKVISNMEHTSIKLPTNEGFVGAVNAGLKISNAPTVCLLNNDTEVSPRWLEKLISALYADEKMGIIGTLTGPPAKKQKYDSHHNISYQQRFREVPVFPEFTNFTDFNLKIEKQLPGVTGKVDFVAFLCACIKREVIDKVGHLDPNFAMGMWDDADYNRSAQKLGYKTELLLDTCIYHKGRATFSLVEREENLDIPALLKKNRAYLDKKWRGINIKPTIVPESIPIIISRAVYYAMGDKKELGILTENRLDLMQRYFINSLQNQTDSGFVIYLVVGPENNETTTKIKSLNWYNLGINFIHSNGDLLEWKNSAEKSRNFGREIDQGCPEDLVRRADIPKTSIMARLDTDDWVTPGWIAHMKHMAATKPESHFLINYQVIGQALDGRLYEFFAPHSRERVSPFMSIVQKAEPRISPYEEAHFRMGKKFTTIYTIPPSYAFMVIHKGNRSNRFYKLDKFYEDIGDESKGEIIIPKIEEIKIEEVEIKIPNIQNLNLNPDNWQERIARAQR